MFRGLVTTGLALATGSWLAWAHSDATTSSGSSQATETAPAHSTGMMGGMEMMEGGMMGTHMTANGQGMMGTTNMMGWGAMTPRMQQRGHMMMHATLTRNDPAAVLGLEYQLELTDDQIAKLEQLQTETGDKVRALLTDAQRAQLDSLPEGPASMAQMYNQMTTHMRRMHGGKSTNANTTATPCQMMGMMAGVTPDEPAMHSDHQS